MSTNNRSNIGAIVGWAILGGTLTGVAALLLAPRKGTETRDQLKEGVNHLFEKSAKLVDEARKGAGKQLGSVRETFSHKVSELSEALETGRKGATEAVSEAIAHGRKGAQEALANGIDKASELAG
jgi:gas vesicle protein